MALLPALGAPIDRPEHIHQALRDRRFELVNRALEPVVVVWDDRPHVVPLRLADARRTGPYRIEVLLEDGNVRATEGRLEHLHPRDNWHVEGINYQVVDLPLGRNIPEGYHQIRVSFGSRVQQALLISSPHCAYLPEKARQWGVFAPMYALHDKDSMGGGGIREMSRMVDWVKEAGGDLVATLPLMSTFLDEPCEPSPYAPVSRLFWNKLFLDIGRLPELARDDAARTMLNDNGLLETARALNAREFVDYRTQATLQRRILSSLAETAFTGDSRDELEQFAAAHPRARDYARFRATAESRNDSWHTWPAPLRDGDLTDVDFPESNYRYHLYVQLRMQQQLAALATKSRGLGTGIYLDMPLGVHPDGYDAWRERSSFMAGASAGAPPDELFAGGQDWGFRPLHPERIRFAQYDYVIACIRHQMSCAGALRIDHVMGLHRIFCIPQGMGGDQGIYVHYRPEELYAILNLESARHRAFLVGEDLGTVPDAVRASMDRHQFHRMYVTQFSFRHDRHHAVLDAPQNAVASFNTHDTPTFTAFWEGHDIDDRLALNHLRPEAAPHERAGRESLRHNVIGFLQDRGLLKGEATTEAVYQALLTFIGTSQA
ncbi:MAG: 4-alpha-glucanotransferase, partial [Myxococcota bacterium]